MVTVVDRRQWVTKSIRSNYVRIFVGIFLMASYMDIMLKYYKYNFKNNTVKCPSENKY